MPVGDLSDNSMYSIPQKNAKVNTHAKIFLRVIQDCKKAETGVISDTMLGTQASTRLLPVSDISIPQLIQKINPKGKKIRLFLRRMKMKKEKWVTVVLGDGTRRRTKESNLKNVTIAIEKQKDLMRKAGFTEKEIENELSVTIVKDEE